jgi:hypothetical protein
MGNHFSNLSSALFSEKMKMASSGNVFTEKSTGTPPIGQTLFGCKTLSVVSKIIFRFLNFGAKIQDGVKIQMTN